MRRVSGSLIFGWTQPLGGRPCPSPFPRWRDVLSLGCGVWRQCLRMGGTLGPCTGVGGGPRAPRPPFPRSLAPQSLHRLCGNPRTSGRSGADHGRSPSSRVSVASPLSGTPHPTAMPRPTQTLRPRCHGDGDAPRLRPRCGRQRVSPPRRKEPTRAEASAALLPK